MLRSVILISPGGILTDFGKSKITQISQRKVIYAKISRKKYSTRLAKKLNKVSEDRQKCENLKMRNI